MSTPHRAVLLGLAKPSSTGRVAIKHPPSASRVAGGDASGGNFRGRSTGDEDDGGFLPVLDRICDRLLQAGTGGRLSFAPGSDRLVGGIKPSRPMLNVECGDVES